MSSKDNDIVRRIWKIVGMSHLLSSVLLPVDHCQATYTNVCFMLTLTASGCTRAKPFVKCLDGFGGALVNWCIPVFTSHPHNPRMSVRKVRLIRCSNLITHKKPNKIV